MRRFCFNKQILKLHSSEKKVCNIDIFASSTCIIGAKIMSAYVKALKVGLARSGIQQPEMYTRSCRQMEADFILRTLINNDTVLQGRLSDNYN